jgi:hypothetical protein
MWDGTGTRPQRVCSCAHRVFICQIRVDGSNSIYLFTPWSRVLREKLTGFAASQEIPAFYGTRKFITVLTSARQLSLSWARSIQSPQPLPTSWRSILILSSHLRLGGSNSITNTKIIIVQSNPTPHKIFFSYIIFNIIESSPSPPSMWIPKMFLR